MRVPDDKETVDDTMDADSDHSDTDYYDEADSSDNTNTFDRLPLVPTDFSSIQEALHNFVVVFESRSV